MIHELKIRKEFFDAVIIGKKTFEVRKNDRGFKVGDRIHFTIVDERGNECEKLPKEVDEKYNNFVITYVLPGGDYGLHTGYCVLGIKQLVIFNSADEPISRVRDLISVLNFSRPDDIITINVDEQEDVWYELIDVMRGSGTAQGITTLRIESQEEE